MSSRLFTMSIGLVCACAFCFLLIVNGDCCAGVSNVRKQFIFCFLDVARPRAALPSGGPLCEYKT